MGERDESLPVRFIFGTSGQVRPLQEVGGKCVACNEDVWVDVPKSNKQYDTYRMKVLHWSCR